MEKDLVETFLTIAKVNNISEASRVLYVSQATVSSLLSKRANPRLSSLLKMADTLGMELTLKSAKIKE